MNSRADLMGVADRLISAKDWAGARSALERLLQDGEHAEALLKLSYLESADGHHAAASDYALRVTRAPSLETSSLLRLMNRLRHFNENFALHEILQRHAPFQSLDAGGLHAVATHFSALEEHQQALEYLNRSIRLFRNNPSAMVARAQIHMFLGDFDAARSDAENCLSISPLHPQAWWTLSHIGTATNGRNNVTPLRDALARLPAGKPGRSHLLFALHKELDELGEYDDAWNALTEGCALRRSEQHYDASESEQIFETLARLPLGEASRSIAADQQPTPIFIVGMFRSGTTLLETLISGHPSVKSGGELREMMACMQYATDHHCKGIIDSVIVDRARRVDYSAVADDYMRRIAWRINGQTHLTDKMPANFLHTGFILAAFPRAKVLHMVRDPIETCFSNLREHFSGFCPYSYVQQELADYFIRYRRLMDHWHENFPGRIHDVHYDGLTAATESTMQGVADFCDLQFRPEMLDPTARAGGVSTASAVQVRAPITARRVPKWTSYRSHLTPLIDQLDAAGM